jgi:hypothetical protein
MVAPTGADRRPSRPADAANKGSLSIALLLGIALTIGAPGPAAAINWMGLAATGLKEAPDAYVRYKINKFYAQAGRAARSTLEDDRRYEFEAARQLPASLTAAARKVQAWQWASRAGHEAAAAARSGDLRKVVDLIYLHAHTGNAETVRRALAAELKDAPMAELEAYAACAQRHVDAVEAGAAALAEEVSRLSELFSKNPEAFTGTPLTPLAEDGVRTHSLARAISRARWRASDYRHATASAIAASQFQAWAWTVVRHGPPDAWTQSAGTKRIALDALRIRAGVEQLAEDLGLVGCPGVLSAILVADFAMGGGLVGPGE